MRRAERPMPAPALALLLACCVLTPSFRELYGGVGSLEEERWEPSLQVVERWTKLGVATTSPLVDLGGT